MHFSIWSGGFGNVIRLLLICATLQPRRLLAKSAKILVYSPTISRSHMQMNARIADTLAEDGHDVTLIDVHYMIDPAVVNYVKVAKREVFRITDGDGGAPVNMKAVTEAAFQKTNPLKELVFILKYQGIFQSYCKRHLDAGRILDFIRVEQFDMVINEHVDYCGTAMSYVGGIRTNVLLSTCPLFEHTAALIGAPTPTSFVPSYAHVRLADRMTYWERVDNTVGYLISYLGLRYGSMLVNDLFAEKFSGLDDVDQIVSDSPLTLVYADEFVDFPRPTYPNTVYIGGLGLSASSDLDPDFAQVMARGSRGVVLFSLGSITTTKFLPQPFMANVVSAMEELADYQFVVKVDADDTHSRNLARAHSNVHFTAWAPQTQMLAHPRLKLFITHGGYNSVLEAAYGGVPVLLLPSHIDQHRNARVPERNGWGKSFDKTLLLKSHAEFKESMMEVLNNENFKANASRMQRILENKPFTARDRLTKFITLLAVSDGKLPELQPFGRNLDLIVYFNLDIFVPFFVAFLVIFYIALIATWKVLKHLYRWKFSRKSKKE